LSLRTACRPTPISTTGLPFPVRVSTAGVVDLQDIAFAGAMPIRTSRMLGREENLKVIGDVLRLADNVRAEHDRGPLGKLPFRVPPGRGAGRS
jgi:hypothetical protein